MIEKFADEMSQNEWRCPEAISHGSADRAGRCPWCRQKITTVAPAPVNYPVSELTLAYGEYYDPDFYALTYNQIRNRYEMGQNS